MNLHNVRRNFNLPIPRGRQLSSTVLSSSRCLKLSNSTIPSGNLMSFLHQLRFKVCKLYKRLIVLGNSNNSPLSDKSRYLRCNNLSTSSGSCSKLFQLKSNTLRNFNSLKTIVRLIDLDANRVRRFFAL
ncbi:hypothetical protein FRX31_004259 [Thalictrum thalictroides]|uniref:Uncharacterized protein n=1 Tax=Thalictrum thalictroides TaxID=46969 RepID=A0A7J6X8V3_THATH|nr:hypothetical protein FRX31_004259 [Thalictrum thalictroides]